MRADQLPYRRVGKIINVDWSALEPGTARRLQEFGIDEGVAIELMHAGPMGRDPLAIRVGRMTIALRRSQASAISVALAEAAE